MESVYIFPFDEIKKGSRIIIYGLGRFGRIHIDQVCRTGYCDIIAVSDQDDNIDCMGYCYVSPKDIIKEDFDYIVITISNSDIATKAYWDLVSYGIDKDRLVGILNNVNKFFPVYTPEEIETDHGAPLSVSVTLDGGIGDYIVCLGFIKKLRETVPDVVIDIYGKRIITDFIYDEEDNIRELYESDTGKDNPQKYTKDYDLAIRLVLFPQIEYCNYSRVKKNKSLYEKIIKMTKDPFFKDLRWNPWDLLKVYDRAYLLGYDRYRTLGQGDIWNIKPEDARITVKGSYEEEFNKLNLSNYITFNCGAAQIVGHEDMIQTKVWSKERFGELIIEIKRRYPQICIVQVGDERSERIEGADEYCLNKNIEVVKHVLANALLHIDGEGGLVHMATQLGTKCVVLFGPTPVWFYGYKDNINIVSSVCTNCCHITPDWYTRCIKGYRVPKCMESISVNDVLTGIEQSGCLKQ